MRGSIGTPTYLTFIYPKKISHLIKDYGKLPREVKFRLSFIKFYEENKNVELTCRRFVISKKTFYKWYKRYQKENINGLFDRPRTPKKKRKPDKREKYKDIVIETRKKYPNWSKEKIASYLKEEHNIEISPSTVYRILKEANLIERSKAKRKEKKQIKSINKKRVKKGIKPKNIGEVIQIDTKHITKKGKTEYQFTAIDVKSRLLYSEIYPTKSSRNARKFLENALKFFEFDIKAVQTDNGSEFLGEFHKYLEKKGIEHYFSYPNSPKTNAIVERVIRTIDEELWLYEGTEHEIDILNEKLRKYIRIYNFKRPHKALNNKRPADIAYTN